MRNILLLVFCLILFPISSGALEIGNIDDELIVSIETPEPPLNISNLSVLSANIWNTTNQGPLSSTAQIDHDLINNLAWSVAGHTFDENVDFGGFDIFNVNNVIANNFIGNNSFWINDSGIINTTTNADYYFIGNISANDVNVRSGSSVTLGDLPDFIVKLSAAEFSFGNSTRKIFQIDQSTGIVQARNGTIGLGVQNIDNSELSSSFFSVTNSLAGHIGILKFSSNFTGINQTGFLYNEDGDFFIGNVKKGTPQRMIFGFHDNVPATPTFDILGVPGRVEVITLDDNNSATPYMTRFNYDVNFTNLTTFQKNVTFDSNITIDNYGFFGFIGSITNRVTKIWASALDVSGNINQSVGDAFINNIYGYAKMKNETGVVIDLISVGVFENITEINNGSVVNGVTYDGDHAFTINHSGTYEVSASISFAGASATEYFFDFIVNNVEQNIFSIRQITTANAEGSTSLGPYAINLNSGDVVTLGIADGITPIDPTIIGVQFGIRRIGE